LVEGARLESVYTSKGYRGFESPSLRRMENRNDGGKVFIAFQKTVNQFA